MPKQSDKKRKKRRKAGQLAAFRGIGDPRGDKLTDREEAFVEAMTGPAEGNAAKAAQLAGYESSSIGYTKMRIPQIRRAIDERLEALVELGAAVEPIELHALWRRLLGHPDPNVALRASENAAKTLGMFVSKSHQQIDVTDHTPKVGMDAFNEFLNQLSGPELEAFIAFVQAKKRANGQIIDVKVIEDNG